MALTQPTVMLLEDDAATRELYCRELSRSFAVVACRNEQEVAAQLSAAQEQGMNVDVLVLEPAALKSDARHFVTSVRRLYPRLPIVVCSVLDVRGRSAELGASVCLIKPVTPAVLASTLFTVLGGRPTLEANDKS
jgi:DNA-binding response OmpR family regulator